MTLCLYEIIEKQHLWSRVIIVFYHFNHTFVIAEIILIVTDVLSEDMVRTMNPNAIVFAMSNPVPEIMPDKAIAAGAAVVGTGRSDFPNQINNVLAFPGIFRGALDCRASAINEEMKMAASLAIASLVSDEELSPEYILPAAFDERIARTVADAVIKAAKDTGVARI